MGVVLLISKQSGLQIPDAILRCLRGFVTGMVRRLESAQCDLCERAAYKSIGLKQARSRPAKSEPTRRREAIAKINVAWDRLLGLASIMQKEGG